MKLQILQAKWYPWALYAQWYHPYVGEIKVKDSRGGESYSATIERVRLNVAARVNSTLVNPPMPSTFKIYPIGYQHRLLRNI